MGIQDEEHVFSCPLVKDLVKNFSKQCVTPADFFKDTKPDDLNVLHKIMNSLSDFNTETIS